MADTVVSDGIPFPQDEGLPNIADDTETWAGAGLLMALAQAVDSGSYVRSDSELTFTGHDGTNDEVDVTGGIAYLDLSGETVDVQSAVGGSTANYDTPLPTLPAIMVVCPTTTANLAAQASMLSTVWLAYATDGAVTNVSAGDVYLRSDDTGSVTAPPHPSVDLGQANPDNAGADTLSNRYPAPEVASLRTATIIDDDDGTSYDVGDDLASGGGGGTSFSRTDVTTTSTTLSPWDSAWVDTASAGGNVTVTLPADGSTSDGDEVRIGIEDATNDTDVAANTGQSILGNNPTLTQAGSATRFEFKSSTSTWMTST